LNFAGENKGRLRQGLLDSLTTPIVQTSTYTFKDTAELIAYQEGRHGSFEYGRYGNPTARVVEEKIMALEGAEDCLLSSSGMCSATTMLLALVPQDGHIVTTTDCYRRTRQFIQTVLPKMGISCTVIDPADIKGLHRWALCTADVRLYTYACLFAGTCTAVTVCLTTQKRREKGHAAPVGW
jgi:cystathionine gamma-synthase